MVEINKARVLRIVSALANDARTLAGSAGPGDVVDELRADITADEKYLKSVLRELMPKRGERHVVITYRDAGGNESRVRAPASEAPRLRRQLAKIWPSHKRARARKRRRR